MHEIDRTALYEQVWAEPLSQLATKLGVSYPTLRAACLRAAVPLPDRGHWARLSAGKPVVRARLPLRPPGLHELVQIGGGGYRIPRQLTRAEILGDMPDPPSFAEPMEHLEDRVRAALGAVKVPRTMDKVHHVIARLLKADDERREQQRRARWPSFCDAPRFESPFEQRRLRILNAIFMALSRAAAAKPSLSGREAREITLKIGDEIVGLRLDTPRNVIRDPVRESLEARGAGSPMCLVVLTGPWRSKARWTWQDDKKQMIEAAIEEAAPRILLAAELQYREGLEWHHKWRIERRAELIEEERLAREKAACEARERAERLARERIEALLADAEALTKAAAIRGYVERASALASAAGHSPAVVDQWAQWALSVADTLDPVTSGRFAAALADEDAAASVLHVSEDTRPEGIE